MCQISKEHCPSLGDATATLKGPDCNVFVSVKCGSMERQIMMNVKTKIFATTSSIEKRVCLMIRRLNENETQAVG